MPEAAPSGWSCATLDLLVPRSATAESKRYAMRRFWTRLKDDAGAATAEYAIVIMATVGR